MKRLILTTFFTVFALSTLNVTATPLSVYSDQLNLTAEINEPGNRTDIYELKIKSAQKEIISQVIITNGIPNGVHFWNHHVIITISNCDQTKSETLQPIAFILNLETEKLTSISEYPCFGSGISATLRIQRQSSMFLIRNGLPCLHCTTHLKENDLFMIQTTPLLTSYLQ